MASDLISRKRLLDALGVAFKASDPEGEEQIGYLNARLIAREIPAVDAVEVVRCKDCVLWSRVDKIHGRCPFLLGDHQYTGPDHYCSCGDRGEEDAFD